MSSFDPAALRAKYREERDKRLRPDGNDQYVELTGRFAHFLDDPYVEPSTLEREPTDRAVDVVVIGGGFGGQLMGARLREAGVDDLCIIEKGGDFGGTWYWNRYPGAMCDVEAYVYLPLLEELGYVPTEKYAHAPEILAHARAIGEHYDLYRGALFGTEVTELRWDDEQRRWIVHTNRGDALRARFVCSASGPLHRAKLPGVPGIESFAGHSFHTSRWDYDYTGGDADGGLVGLRDKRVGIIGTGATAVQVVPAVAERAEHLYVFQRTPSSVDVRANRATDGEWAASLTPGWQKRRIENFTNLTSGTFDPEDLVMDGWTDIIGRLFRLMKERSADGMTGAKVAQTMEMADFEKMEQIRARVDELVRDPAVAAALKPYYRQFCKRPCFHDEYLQAFNRDNVTLVDTDGRGIDRITPRGVVANGVEYDLDCIIYATGFEVGTSYTRRSGMELYGRGGISLTEHWADGVKTMHGFFTRGFPNCFIISLMQSAMTANFPHMLDEQAIHLAYVIGHALANDVEVVEVTEEAQAAWVETIIASSAQNLRFQQECTPGYYNNEGQPSELSRQNGAYGAGPVAFIELLRDWRAAGDLAGLELTRSAPA